MKRKLRSIIVAGFEYLYAVAKDYYSASDTNTLTVRVYLKGQKNTPLVIDFLTMNHYFIEQILKSGVKLMNKIRNAEEIVNLNEPKYIIGAYFISPKKRVDRSK